MDEDPIIRFRTSAAAHGAGTVAGDSLATNRAYDQMIEAVRALRLLPDKGRAQLTNLLHDPDPAVKYLAATYLLPLSEGTALGALEEVIRLRIPLIRLSAEMVVQEWRKGHLKLP